MLTNVLYVPTHLQYNVLMQVGQRVRMCVVNSRIYIIEHLLCGQYVRLHTHLYVSHVCSHNFRVCIYMRTHNLCSGLDCVCL